MLNNQIKLFYFVLGFGVALLLAHFIIINRLLALVI